MLMITLGTNGQAGAGAAAGAEAEAAAGAAAAADQPSGLGRTRAGAAEQQQRGMAASAEVGSGRGVGLREGSRGGGEVVSGDRLFGCRLLWNWLCSKVSSIIMVLACPSVMQQQLSLPLVHLALGCVRWCVNVLFGRHAYHTVTLKIRASSWSLKALMVPFQIVTSNWRIVHHSSTHARRLSDSTLSFEKKVHFNMYLR